MRTVLIKMGYRNLLTKNKIFDSYYSILYELYLVKFLEAISLLIKQVIWPAKMLKFLCNINQISKIRFYKNASEYGLNSKISKISSVTKLA